MSDINELIGNEDWNGALAALGATVEACEYPNGAADAIYEAFTAVPNDNARSEAFVLGAVGLLCAKQNANGETMAANWKADETQWLHSPTSLAAQKSHGWGSSSLSSLSDDSRSRADADASLAAAASASAWEASRMAQTTGYMKERPSALALMRVCW